MIPTDSCCNKQFAGIYSRLRKLLLVKFNIIETKRKFGDMCETMPLLLQIFIGTFSCIKICLILEKNYSGIIFAKFNHQSNDFQLNLPSSIFNGTIIDFLCLYQSNWMIFNFIRWNQSSMRQPNFLELLDILIAVIMVDRFFSPNFRSAKRNSVIRISYFTHV